MKYEKAMAEVVEFDNSDVMTASPTICLGASQTPCTGNLGDLGFGCDYTDSTWEPGVEEGPGAGSW